MQEISSSATLSFARTNNVGYVRSRYMDLVLQFDSTLSVQVPLIEYL